MSPQNRVAVDQKQTEPKRTLGLKLELDKCPYCSTANPNLSRLNIIDTVNYRNENRRFWSPYKCETCGGVTLAHNNVGENREIDDFIPHITEAPIELPEDARRFLNEALDTPGLSAAILVANSSVDEMLKDKGFKKGDLKSRIKEAAENGAITADMEKWSHLVRLSSNLERHPKDKTKPPDTDDRKDMIDFALAMAHYLYVMPAMVKKGMQDYQDRVSGGNKS